VTCVGDDDKSAVDVLMFRDRECASASRLFGQQDSGEQESVAREAFDEEGAI
jgi:hypothetical protein